MSGLSSAGGIDGQRAALPAKVGRLDALQKTTDRSRFMRVLHDYEREAARFG